jgi:hypothetical protein
MGKGNKSKKAKGSPEDAILQIESVEQVDETVLNRIFQLTGKHHTHSKPSFLYSGVVCSSCSGPSFLCVSLFLPSFFFFFFFAFLCLH